MLISKNHLPFKNKSGLPVDMKRLFNQRKIRVLELLPRYTALKVFLINQQNEIIFYHFTRLGDRKYFIRLTGSKLLFLL
jgi:hypothetical protein